MGVLSDMKSEFFRCLRDVGYKCLVSNKSVRDLNVGLFLNTYHADLFGFHRESGTKSSIILT